MLFQAALLSGWPPEVMLQHQQQRWLAGWPGTPAVFAAAWHTAAAAEQASCCLLVLVLLLPLLLQGQLLAPGLQ
jgi:hypothetical protein